MALEFSLSRRSMRFALVSTPKEDLKNSLPGEFALPDFYPGFSTSLSKLVALFMILA